MLGTRIAAQRQRLGLSQAQLAKKLHISASAVGMYEQGRREPSVDVLIALSRELDVSIDYLLTGIPPTNSKPAPAAAMLVFAPAGEMPLSDNCAVHLLSHKELRHIFSDLIKEAQQNLS